VSSPTFLPSHNFMEVIPEIEKSEVFKILHMPKGAVLHAHGSAIASLHYRFNNLAYRENLYVCDKNSILRLKFFDVPSNDCNWELLSKKIKRSMTMVTENPNSVYNTVDKAWEKFDSVFKAWKFLISYRLFFEDLHYRNLQELYEDNVMYAEIRSTLSSIYDLDGKTFVKNHPDFIGAKIIYAPRRLVNQERLRRHYPDFIAGFDLVDQKDKGKSLSELSDKLSTVEPGIPFFFHAGDEMVRNVDRLESLRCFLAQHQTHQPRVLGLVEDMRNHPAASLFASGSPVMVSNDDPGIIMSIMSVNSDLRSLKQLTINSLTYSSLSKRQQRSALGKCQVKWDVFVAKLANNVAQIKLITTN
ncbi:Uncharacterized protein DBV15_12033, partial [Temnothorax longispinosus]